MSKLFDLTPLGEGEALSDGQYESLMERGHHGVWRVPKTALDDLQAKATKALNDRIDNLIRAELPTAEVHYSGYARTPVFFPPFVPSLLGNMYVALHTTEPTTMSTAVPPKPPEPPKSTLFSAPTPGKMIGKVTIYNTADVVDQNHSVLYMGPPKTGKTHCAMSWPSPFVIYYDPNLATLTKFKGVPFCLPKGYNELATGPLMAIQNRQIEARTIVLDSASFFADAIIQEEKGGRAKLDYSGWGNILEKLSHTFRILTDATKPYPGRPDLRTYHLVATCHERDVTDDSGSLLRVTPAIPGQFRDQLARFFNTVLITQAQVKNVTTPSGPGTPSTVSRAASYKVWTIPPDPFRACGDGVGGGRYKILPIQTDGTYQSLMSGWGMPTNGDTSPNRESKEGTTAVPPGPPTV